MTPAKKSLLTSLFAAQEYLARGYRMAAGDTMRSAWSKHGITPTIPLSLAYRLDVLETRCFRNVLRDISHERERDLFFSIGDLIRDVIALPENVVEVRNAGAGRWNR